MLDGAHPAQMAAFMVLLRMKVSPQPSV